MDKSEKVYIESVEAGNKIISDYTGTQGNYRFDATLWKVLFESLMSAPMVISVNLQFSDAGGSFMIRYKDNNHQYPNQVMAESWDFDQPFTTPEHAIWFVALRMITFIKTDSTKFYQGEFK